MKHKQLVRFMALLLVILLAGGAVVSALISVLAEEAAPARDSYEAVIEYMEDEQALHISQRLFYHNRSGRALDSVAFYATGNMFRRESALIYESDVLESAFPDGYAPAGIDLRAVRCNGVDADWGYQDENEMQLRVLCAVEPGEVCAFEFDYYLLLSENCAMIGQYETDVRLSAFLFTPGVYSEAYGDFVLNTPIQHTRWLYTAAADYAVTLILPDQYLPAATGSETLVSTENHRSTWEIRAQNVREFALSFGRRYREYTVQTDSGVTLRMLSNHRGSAKSALSYAAKVVELYESWLGAFPTDCVDLIQSDYAVDALNFPGVLWLPDALFDDQTFMNSALRFCLAQQYIGLTAYAEPVADAWLSDVPCSYLALLAVESLDGYDAFLTALNAQVLDALRITLPGGLYISADASLFTAEEYSLIVRDRGAVVMHEMRVAMGRDDLIAALRTFYEMGLEQELLGEYDLVHAMDAATGGDWEDFLTDWLFNVDEYVDQQIEYYE